MFQLCTRDSFPAGCGWLRGPSHSGFHTNKYARLQAPSLGEAFKISKHCYERGAWRQDKTTLGIYKSSWCCVPQLVKTFYFSGANIELNLPAFNLRWFIPSPFSDKQIDMATATSFNEDLGVRNHLW